MGTDRENVVPGNLCIIWKLNEPWPLKKDSVTFLRLLKLLKLKKNSITALLLKVFNTEKGHHHCIKVFNTEKGLHHLLRTLKVFNIGKGLYHVPSLSLHTLLDGNFDFLGCYLVVTVPYLMITAGYCSLPWDYCSLPLVILIPTFSMNQHLITI